MRRFSVAYERRLVDDSEAESALEDTRTDELIDEAPVPMRSRDGRRMSIVRAREPDDNALTDDVPTGAPKGVVLSGAQRSELGRRLADQIIEASTAEAQGAPPTAAAREHWRERILVNVVHGATQGILDLADAPVGNMGVLALTSFLTQHGTSCFGIGFTLNLSGCRFGEASAPNIAALLTSPHVRVGKLVLRGTELGTAGITHILSALAQRPPAPSSALTSLVISGTHTGAVSGLRVGLDGARAMRDLLSTSTTLRYLSLSSCNLGTSLDSARSLGIALASRSCCLASLDISNNGIGPEFVRLLCAPMVEAPRATRPRGVGGASGGAHDALSASAVAPSRLARLVFSCNPIGSVGAAAVATLLRSPSGRSVRVLELAKCGISVLGVTLLTDALAYHTSIRELTLDDNPLNDSPSGAFARVRAEYSEAEVEELRTNLERRNLMGEDLVVSPALTQNRSLRVLSLVHCSVGDLFARSLAGGLRGSSLRALLLSRNFIGDSGATAIASALFAAPRSIDVQLARAAELQYDDDGDEAELESTQEGGEADQAKADEYEDEEDEEDEEEEGSDASDGDLGGADDAEEGFDDDEMEDGDYRRRAGSSVGPSSSPSSPSSRAVSNNSSTNSKKKKSTTRAQRKTQERKARAVREAQQLSETRTDVRLEIFDIAHNRIGDAGVAALARGIEAGVDAQRNASNGHIVGTDRWYVCYFSIVHNLFGTEGSKALLDLLQKQLVVSCDAMGNNVSHGAAAKIAEVSERNLTRFSRRQHERETAAVVLLAEQARAKEKAEREVEKSSKELVALRAELAALEHLRGREQRDAVVELDMLTQRLRTLRARRDELEDAQIVTNTSGARRAAEVEKEIAQIHSRVASARAQRAALEQELADARTNCTYSRNSALIGFTEEGRLESVLRAVQRQASALRAEVGTELALLGDIVEASRPPPNPATDRRPRVRFAAFANIPPPRPLAELMADVEAALSRGEGGER